jgi:hypothetical protein
LALDAAPFFSIASYLPEPNYTTDRSTPTLKALLAKLGSSSDDFSDTCDALASVAHLSNLINEQASDSNFFRSDDTRTRVLFPVAHRILRLRRLRHTTSTISSPADITREATRLALFLYVSAVKRRFSMDPDFVDMQKDRLLRFLTSVPVDESAFPELWLWIYAMLVVAMPHGERAWVSARIAALMESMGIWSWLGEADPIIRGIAWTDEVSLDGLAQLGLDIQQYQYRGV